MKTVNMVLDLLEKNKGKYVSGGKIASFLGISRNSVWKAVKQLQDKGYEIDAVTNKGYVLTENNNLISAQSVRKFITAENICIDVRDSVTSTNTLLKKMAENGEKEGYVLLAKEQTEGRGRLGRSFSSLNETGVYFSILLRPDMNPSDALLITTCAAVAVAKAIENNTGKMTSIKWVNDIYMRDRKVCGILTEASFDMENGKLSYAVLGIGINMYFPENTLPEEIENIAGAVFDKKPEGDIVSRIVADVINIFMAEYRVITGKHFLFDYCSRSYLDEKEISVIKPDGVRNAVALGIDDDFRLHVRYESGEEEYLSTGEVSTKVKN